MCVRLYGVSAWMECPSGWKKTRMCVRLEKRLEKSDLFDDEVERHMLQKAGLLLEVQAGEGMGV